MDLEEILNCQYKCPRCGAYDWEVLTGTDETKYGEEVSGKTVLQLMCATCNAHNLKMNVLVTVKLIQTS